LRAREVFTFKFKFKFRFLVRLDGGDSSQVETATPHEQGVAASSVVYALSELKAA